MLPHVHDGDYDVLRFIDYRHAQPTIVRLWPSRRIVKKNGIEKPLWVGGISTLRQEKIMGLTLWRTTEDFTVARQRFLQGLQAIKAGMVFHTVTTNAVTPVQQVMLLDAF